MEEESELVTGEAVVLDLRVAKLATRAVAMLLDVLVQGALLLAVYLVLSLTTSLDDDSLLLTLILVVFILVMVGYPVLFETLSRGRSLGKMAMGLRVVRLDGGPIRFRQALTRGLAGFFVDFWALGFLGAVAVIVSLCSSNGRRTGDYLAGTLVIRERVSQAPQSYVPMPPELALWASQLDLSHLPAELALAIRQYLGRAAELRPEAAAALGHGLAQQVTAIIGAPVPPGVHVWSYLAAVLAERRGREQARLLPQVQTPQPYPQQPYPQQQYAPQQPYPHQQPAYSTPYAQYQQPVAPPAPEPPAAAPAEPESPFAPPS
ncbi:RDD family protein [Amycolatopsis sp. H20-H5]|uniref:RDD family protein n=1 Tax=Amycolatopsis sp. H20-H5 TaxID=3046309 RepID=UPI002DBD8FE8|nr:RDD family protein [Amycolatopsis sp. H20-H5]MEC3978808.1 RDD family protein [Amycolatopsis sp. H20-H5]